jgi:hypothetical protein
VAFKRQAMEVKIDNIIDMAITFTAMIRVFEKNSKPKISKLLKDVFLSLSEIKTKDDYEKMHAKFCNDFSRSIKTAEKNLKNGICKEGKSASFGHAAKVLDIAIKVYVYYGSLPDATTSERITPFLKAAIDNPILKELKKKNPNKKISATNIESIDCSQYEELQKLINQDIQTVFQGSIYPVQYDDIVWNKLNR